MRSIPGQRLPLGSGTSNHAPGRRTLCHIYYPSLCLPLQPCSPSSSVPPSRSAPSHSRPHPASARCPSSLVAGWHWSHPPGLASQHISFPSLAAERGPPAPEASCVTCVPPGPPKQGVGLAPQPGLPKPAVTQRGTEQAQGEALTSGLGFGGFCPPCPPATVPAGPGKGEGARPC